MGGFGEDVVVIELEINDTQRDCVSCLFYF